MTAAGFVIESDNRAVLHDADTCGASANVDNRAIVQHEQTHARHELDDSFASARSHETDALANPIYSPSFAAPTQTSRRIEGTDGWKAPANPTAQWRSNPSPPVVSSKTGISAVRAGDFGRFSPKLPIFGFWRPGSYAKNPRKMQGFRVQIDHNLRSSECVAEAVGIEPPIGGNQNPRLHPNGRPGTWRMPFRPRRSMGGGATRRFWGFVAGWG